MQDTGTNPSLVVWGDTIRTRLVVVVRLFGPLSASLFEKFVHEAFLRGLFVQSLAAFCESPTCRSNVVEECVLNVGGESGFEDALAELLFITHGAEIDCDNAMGSRGRLLANGLTGGRWEMISWGGRAALPLEHVCFSALASIATEFITEVDFVSFSAADLMMVMGPRLDMRDCAVLAASEPVCSMLGSKGAAFWPPK